MAPDRNLSSGSAGHHDEHDEHDQHEGQQPRAQDVAPLRRHACSPRARQPVPVAHADATSTVMIVDPSAGRKVIWIRHSGRSAATSITWLPSSSAVPVSMA